MPAIDGGAYAIDTIDGGVWYVREEKAVRVSGLEGAIISSVIPTAEGGVYLHVLDEGKSGGLWYLKGTKITKVEEKAPVSVTKAKE